ncbi:unnamed protein product, partial [Discosporangium mesarthrocarpum]
MANLHKRASGWRVSTRINPSVGSYFEMMDSATMASSTAYYVLHRTLEAIDSCLDLTIVLPDDDRQDHVAAGFKARSKQGIMNRCVRAVDGLFIRITLLLLGSTQDTRRDSGSTFRRSAMHCTSSRRGAFLVQGAPTIGQPGTCQTSNPRWRYSLMSTTSSMILPTHPRRVFLRH